MRRITLCLLLLAPLFSSAQQRIAGDILALLNAGAEFRQAEVLSVESTDIERYPGLSELTEGTVLRVDLNVIAVLQNSDSPLISITVPTSERRSITLDLMEHDILTPGFRLYTSDNHLNPLPYTAGKHYCGMIHGDINSLVAISVFNDEIMGMISSQSGNLVLGKIRGSREHLHVLYQDDELSIKPEWECGTLDDGSRYTKEQLLPQPGQRDPGDCVKVYVEIDDDIVTDKGGATQATNYITGLFNQAITLYQAENIEITISEILAWTTPSPYSGSSANAMLSSYQDLTGTFNGNLSHLVSYQASGGIAASLNGICNPDPDLSKCFSSINSTYQIVPTYSWSAMVITHEMGHLLGSHHTHACVWNGNSTAIDGCAGSTEGGCPLPGNPSEGGTMMSYCQLQPVGVNFSLGFGPQPGNVIRNTVNSAGNCLTSCQGSPPSPEYCTSEGSNQQYEWIESFTLESIDNTSGSNEGYGDFTSQSALLTPGGNYTMTLTPGFSGNAYTEYWGVWIDYNSDKDWDDEGEMVASGFGTGQVALSFTVPASVSSVKTRMRVSMQYNAAPAVCGSYTYGEVEDYTIIVGEEIPTCEDGVQNGDETGVDCGGATCPSCPTCNDGILNGDEEGVDCGGSCPDVCAADGTVLFGHYFETGWDGWSDGGADCDRYFGWKSWEGNYSINIQDNSGVASSMTSPAIDITPYSAVELEFYFYASSMENGEDFFVRYYDGQSYITLATLVSRVHFKNEFYWVATVTITNAEVNFAPNARFRFQCDASDDDDDIYIDAVTLTGFTDTAHTRGVTVEHVAKNIGQQANLIDDHVSDLIILPNPATNDIRIQSDVLVDELRIISSQGIDVQTFETKMQLQEVDLTKIPAGMYILMVRRGSIWTPAKFVKL